MTRFLTLEQALKCIAKDINYHVDAYLQGHPQSAYDRYRASAIDHAVRGLKAPEYCLMTGAKLKNLSTRLVPLARVIDLTLTPYLLTGYAYDDSDCAFYDEVIK